NKQIIQQLMNGAWEYDENLRKAISIFKIEDDDYRHTIEKILSSDFIRRNFQRLNFIMPSYLHMFINRFFVSNQRKVELIIYDWMCKYYESKIAREKKQITPNFSEPRIFFVCLLTIVIYKVYRCHFI